MAGDAGMGLVPLIQSGIRAFRLPFGVGAQGCQLPIEICWELIRIEPEQVVSPLFAL